MLTHTPYRRYYKQQGYKTIVMGASFRTISEIEELAGIDFLTISTGLLEDLKNSDKPVPQKLDVETAKKEQALPKVSYINDEPAFRWELLDESMAFDKLHEGIKKVGRCGVLPSPEAKWADFCARQCSPVRRRRCHCSWLYFSSVLL